jgi:CDP-glucose 4,6-dehydratase
VSHIVDRLAASWGEGAAWHRSAGEHPHEAGVLAIDAAKARSRLGWRPRLDLDVALDWTVNWHRAVLAGEDAAATCLTQIERYHSLS